MGLVKKKQEEREEINIRGSEGYTFLKKRNGRTLLLCQWDVAVKYVVHV